ncbi:acyl-CoA synthetase [Belnapia sp. T6]|uniref:Acyl-CoA synthetase n=1 Tax=Belnapia mucosa TaxID=2804532 RepID=A0ABS1V5T9_9PROT|nr:AMP-binding protein [Belnapia mucosa]MBL6457044.1 acyl-CoA synthetase [Belnapia mucosa]
MPPEPGLPLIGRAAEEVICHRAGGLVTVGRLLAEATTLAAQLPAAGHAVNLCTDRYRMLLGFVAALLRGHPTLLNADASAHRLQALAGQYPGTYLLADAPVATSLPVIRVGEVEAAAGHIAPPLLPADRIAAIAFTSGSTGQPTAHRKPWGALVAAARAAAERFTLRHGDGPPSSILATVPPQHMYGFETTIMLPLQADVACHAGESFFPSDVLDALAALPPRRWLVTTPLHLRALLAEGRRPVPLAGVISATAPLAPNLAEAVERDWAVPMLEIYGASEAGSMASRRSAREADWLPYPGIRMGVEEVEVPGLGAVPLADAIEPTAGERFRLLGRRADLVKLGGRRASLAELNRLLAEVEGVADGVFLAPEDIESNPAARLSAYVVAPGRSAEDILAALRLRLEPVFLPRPLVLVEALPRDRLGKLTRAALRAMATP